MVTVMQIVIACLLLLAIVAVQALTFYAFIGFCLWVNDTVHGITERRQQRKQEAESYADAATLLQVEAVEAKRALISEAMGYIENSSHIGL
jgi:FlaG/FlaF family flagellin (archaellin)